MISFIIPTYMNPTGLATVLGCLKSCFSEYEVLVCFNKGDNSLAFGVDLCKSAEYSSNLRYFIFETVFPTAQIAFCAPLTRMPLVCVLNDSIILQFEKDKADPLISSRVAPFCDEIIALYMCSKAVGDMQYRLPIVSKRFIELVGYIYHPLFSMPKTNELWIGHIFDMIGRTIPVEGFTINDNVEFPSKLVYNKDVVQEHNYHYRNTARIRRETAEMLQLFMVKES